MVKKFDYSIASNDESEAYNPIATSSDILDTTLEDNRFEIFSTNNFDKDKVPFRGTIADLYETLHVMRTGEKIYMFRKNEFEINKNKFPDCDLSSEIIVIRKEFEKEYAIVKKSADPLKIFLGE